MIRITTRVDLAMSVCRVNAVASETIRAIELGLKI